MPKDHGIGASTKRREDIRFLTGRGVYTDDMALHGQTYAVFVRSNVAHVFAAMALGNPYPASHFSELAWNQLVLKAIFNDQPLAEIHGLLERKNPTLAHDICLLAQERWAAGRRIPAFAWCLVADMSYPEESQMIARLAASDDVQDQRAALFLQQKSPDFSTT